MASRSGNKQAGQPEQSFELVNPYSDGYILVIHVVIDAKGDER
jgi:hypothetical protein